jgi:hypothetical protein
MKTVSRLILIVVLCGALAHSGESGTFFNPIGDRGLLEKGDEASALLNEGLASVYSLYAAYERKNTVLLDVHKKAASDKLAACIKLFMEVNNLATVKPLNFTTRDAEESASIDEFQKNTTQRYHVPSPKTQKDLSAIAVVIVSDFKSKLDETKLNPNDDNLGPLWNLMRTTIALEQTGLAVSIIWSKSRN